MSYRKLGPSLVCPYQRPTGRPVIAFEHMPMRHGLTRHSHMSNSTHLTSRHAFSVNITWQSTNMSIMSQSLLHNHVICMKPANYCSLFSANKRCIARSKTKKLTSPGCAEICGRTAGDRHPCVPCTWARRTRSRRGVCGPVPRAAAGEPRHTPETGRREANAPMSPAC